MHTRRWLWVVSLWLLSASLPVAKAQVSAGDKATAEALFDRGLTLLKEGKLEEACARLEQSNAIEHGIGTMLYLADCYERSGRTASAWALFREASSEAQAAGQVERAASGRQRAERLEPSLSRLTVEVPDAARVPGLEVLRNGAPVAKGVWGLPLPVDPGTQHIEARAPGYLPQALDANVERGSTNGKVAIPVLVAAPVEVAAVAPPIQVPSALPPVEPAPIPVPQGLSKQEIAGILIGATGVALLAVGIATGVEANNKNGDAKDAGCHGNVCTTQRGVDLTNKALTLSRVADVGIIGGGAMLVGGLLTYLIKPKHESQTKVAVSADHRGAAIQVGGVF